MAFRKNTTYSSKSSLRARSVHARGDRQFRTYDTSYIQPKRKKGPIIAVVLAIVVVIALIVFLVGKLAGCSDSKADLLPAGEYATIVVVPGEGANDIGESLVEAKLIAKASSFSDYVSKNNLASSLQAGTYRFEGGSPVAFIAQAISEGSVYEGERVVVPEGYRLSEIAQVIQTASGGRVTAAEFTSAAGDASVYAAEYSFLSSAGSNSLEGFLFPKTYTMSDTDTADSMIRKMLDQFGTETASLDFSYPTSVGLSLYDTVKLASIVEKESTTSTKPTVAGVFYNRLTREDGATAGYLQSDATTAYEVGHDPTAEEVHAETPYSTYTNKGLPPTPICNPGLASLQAVCDPELSDYFYFFFANDETGTIQYYFSETYEQHMAVIAEHS